MSDRNAGHHAVLAEQVMLARLRQSDEMREFFIQMWQQNPALARQGGARVQALLTPLSAGPAKQRGATLVELVMFIVIVGIAVTGVLLVMNRTTASSADPLIRKQALAIASSLLEEIELMPFTYCDPDDVNAASAVSAADCTPGLSQDIITGPVPATETRYAATPFDNVADYSTFSMTPIADLTGTPLAGLGNYSASISIARAGIALLGAADDGAALRITVTVNGPDNTQAVLDGYRTRYSPRAVP
jgi:MSHA pilin protein MshD